jgi:hypothetical protein
LFCFDFCTGACTYESGTLPLNHSISPLCVGYFWDWVFLYTLAGLDHIPSIFASCMLPGWHAHITMPSHWLRSGLQKFLP